MDATGMLIIMSTPTVPSTKMFFRQVIYVIHIICTCVRHILYIPLQYIPIMVVLVKHHHFCRFHFSIVLVGRILLEPCQPPIIQKKCGGCPLFYMHPFWVDETRLKQILDTALFVGSIHTQTCRWCIYNPIYITIVNDICSVQIMHHQHFVIIIRTITLPSS